MRRPVLARYHRAPRILWRRVGDGILVTGPGEDAVDHLSPSGAAVWELLDVPQTTSELVAALVGSFEAPSAEIDRDVEALLARLVERGFVRVTRDV